MIELLLAILSSFAISILIKRNELRGRRTPVVIASNYISASILGWAFTLTGGGVSFSLETLALGIGGGVLWPGTFYLLMYGIRRYGISLAGAVCRLSLVVPVMFAFVFLREPLSAARWIGLLAAFAAFYLMHPVRSGEFRQMDAGAAWFFPLLAFCFGVVDLWVNLFNTIGPASEKFAFVTLVFSFSGLFAWAIVGWKRCAVDRASFFQGLVLGFPNFFATYFLMESLKSPFFFERSAVAYTWYSVVGVTLAFSAGVVIWKERVSRTNLIGVAAGLAAIMILNR